MRTLGGSFTASITTFVWDRRAGIHHARLAEHVNPYNPLLQHALAGGGEAYGVIPRTLVDLEVAHTGLTELHVVETMHERKAKMTELTDAFVAIPGGVGTLDELFEAWSWNALGYHCKPFALLNQGGFWNQMIGFLDHVTQSGFMSGARRAQLIVADTIPSVLDALTGAIGKAEPKMVW